MGSLLSAYKGLKPSRTARATSLIVASLLSAYKGLKLIFQGNKVLLDTGFIKCL